MADSRFYASDSPDNHGDPWTPADAESAEEAAQDYAWAYGMEADPSGEDDRVHVILASEADDGPEERNADDGWPLDVHRRWCFRIVEVKQNGVVLEDISDV